MNSGITLVEVRGEAMDTIQKLKAGTIDVKTAAEIRNLLGTVIDVAKTQVEFIKAIPAPVRDSLKTDEIKAMAGTLVDRDADLDITITGIEAGKKNYELLKHKQP